MKIAGYNISKKHAIIFGIGLALVLYYNRDKFKMKAPLNADAAVRGEDNVNSDSSVITRALQNLKNGTVKVNPTPEETKKQL